MNNKDKVTESGAIISWVDKETLRYSIPGYSVLVWVDYEPGFFNSGRIIKSSSIVRWEGKPEQPDKLINKEQKQKILSEIQQYYREQKKSCHIDDL